MLEEKKANVAVCLTEALKEIKYENRMLELKKYFDHQKVDRYISQGKLYQILDLSYNLGTLDDKELYVITKYLLLWQNDTVYLKLNPEEEFEKQDMELNELKVVDMNNKLTIKALPKGTDNNPEWIGIMTYEQIVNADRNGLLRYNMDTQRVPKVVVKNGNVHYIPEIDKNTINEIAKSILENKFQTNTITLNILRKDEPYVNPSVEDGELTINVNDTTKIDIIDGMHRVRGIVQAWQKRELEILRGEKQSQIKGTMAVSVKNLTAERAKSFIYQESLANQQTDRTKNVINNQAVFKKFCQRLNDEPESVYYDKFAYYEEDTDKIPIPFLFEMTKDLFLINKFNNKYTTEKKARPFFNEFCDFETDVFEVLGDDEKYKDVFFLTDIILYFMDAVVNKNVKKNSEELVDDFVTKVREHDIEEFKYDYPLNKKEFSRVRALLKCGLQTDESEVEK